VVPPLNLSFEINNSDCMKKILAGDIGGTNCRLTLCDHSDNHVEICETEVFQSQDFQSLEDILVKFLENKTGTVIAACFGIPGPVVKERVTATNLPWTIELSALRKLLDCNNVFLMNDLAATMAGVLELDHSQKTLLHAGHEPREKDILVIVAPGTGLGQAARFRDVILPSEGGHVEFAPRNQRESKLQEFLRSHLKKTRISMERLVSGPGLENIFNFLVTAEHKKPKPETLERFHTEDNAAVIGESGLKQADSVCAEALEMFVSFLAMHCSNAILTYMSTGGLYLGGGISPKILPLLQSDIFLKTLFDKGRLSPMIESTPVYVITEKFSGLFGASHIAKKSVT
jgi:glucokinase